MKSALALASLLVVACTVPAARVNSTATILGPERSSVLVGQAAKPAALEIVRLFATRGYAVTDTKQQEDGTWILRIAGDRRMATTVDETLYALHTINNVLSEDGNDADQQRQTRHELEEQVLLGSAFYVSVKPLGPEQSSIAIVGRPMHEGREACTPDLPEGCVVLEYDDAPSGELAGLAEAETVNGVFAELRLGGTVLSPDPAIAEGNRAQYAKCQARREYLQDLASKISSDRARANVLRTMPTCAKGTLVATPSK